MELSYASIDPSDGEWLSWPQGRERRRDSTAVRSSCSATSGCTGPAPRFGLNLHSRKGLIYVLVIASAQLIDLLANQCCRRLEYGSELRIRLHAGGFDRQRQCFL
jgi:hypothetical protein